MHPAHQAMINALACAMHAVLEHNVLCGDDPNAVALLQAQFRALAADHEDFARALGLSQALCMVNITNQK